MLGAQTNGSLLQKAFKRCAHPPSETVPGALHVVTGIGIWYHVHYALYQSQLLRSNPGHDGDGGVVLNVVGKWMHKLLLGCFPDILL